MSRPIAKDLAYVDALLEQWAQWGKSGLSALAWPAMTLLARVIEQGFSGAAQPGPLPEMSELVEAVERAILRLDARHRQVVVKHYVYWQPIEVSADYCGVSAGQFTQMLHRARRRIADYIEGRFYSNNSQSIKAAWNECQIPASASAARIPRSAM